MLPALLNHLPTAKPMPARSICNAIRMTEAVSTAHLLSAIQASEGTAYPTNVVVTRPMTATYSMIKSHRFQATRNPI